MDPNQTSTDNQNNPVINLEPETNPTEIVTPPTETPPTAPSQVDQAPPHSEMMTAPQDDILVQETPEEVIPEETLKEPLTEETPLPPTSLLTPETPETKVDPPINVFQPQVEQPEVAITPTLPEVETPATKEPTPQSPGSLRVFFIGLVLVLVGILLGVLASNMVPQNSLQSAIVPPITETPTVTVEVTPEASPSPTLSLIDQNIIDKFGGKKTIGGITPDLIQKCNYKDSDIYTLSEISAKDSPSIIVDDNGKYLMSCGVELGDTTKSKTTNQCDIISLCKEVWSKNKSTVSYICPVGEWIDCMPSPDGVPLTECGSDYLIWAKENCPGFKGAAL